VSYVLSLSGHGVDIEAIRTIFGNAVNDLRTSGEGEVTGDVKWYEGDISQTINASEIPADVPITDIEDTVDDGAETVVNPVDIKDGIDDSDGLDAVETEQMINAAIAQHEAEFHKEDDSDEAATGGEG
jgi:hypothetical protein